MSVRSALACLAVLLAAAVQLGCEETDESLNTEVGVTVLGGSAGSTENEDGLLEPNLRLASLDDPGIQALRWVFTRADLVVGEDSYDLTGGETCTYLSSAVLLPLTLNKCGGGVVVGQTQTSGSSLSIEFRVTASRAEPLDLQPQDDEDGDSVVNAADNCRLEPNPDQEDTNMNGIGDACEKLNVFTGKYEIDNDVDGIIDTFDNCVYIPNADQQDTSFDGIGDACDPPQEAELAISGSTDLRLTLAAGSFSLTSRSTLYAAVDLSIDASLTCDWDAGVCELDPTAVSSCYLPSLQTLPIGCDVP